MDVTEGEMKITYTHVKAQSLLTSFIKTKMSHRAFSTIMSVYDNDEQETRRMQPVWHHQCDITSGLGCDEEEDYPACPGLPAFLTLTKTIRPNAVLFSVSGPWTGTFLPTEFKKQVSNEFRLIVNYKLQIFLENTYFYYTHQPCLFIEWEKIEVAPEGGVMVHTVAAVSWCSYWTRLNHFTCSESHDSLVHVCEREYNILPLPQCCWTHLHTDWQTHVHVSAMC